MSDQKQKEDGYDWIAGTFGPQRRGFVAYTCPACGCEFVDDVRGAAHVPDPLCCIDRVPYPNGREWTRHLDTKPLAVAPEVAKSGLVVVGKSGLLVTLKHRIAWRMRKRA